MTAAPLDVARDALIAVQGQLIAMLAAQNAALAGRAASISVSKFQAVDATSVAAVVQHIQREHVLSYPD